MLITVSMNGTLKFSPGSVTTRTGSPSRTTSACSVWRTTNSDEYADDGERRQNDQRDDT